MQKGFTLVELLVVITLISLLAGVIISVSIPVQVQSRNAQRTSDMYKVQSALEAFRADWGYYPCSVNTDYSYGDSSCGDVNHKVKYGVDSEPARASHSQINDCTGNPARATSDVNSCVPKKVYLSTYPQDPIWPLPHGASYPPHGNHDCYSVFDNSTNIQRCNNNDIKCNYFEVGTNLEIAPIYAYDTSTGYSSECDIGGMHYENYVLTPSGVLPIPSPPAPPLAHRNP